MNKLILKLGWPGALLLLVGALSLGVYTIINQSILDEEKKEITEDIVEIVPKNITEELGQTLKPVQDKPKEENIISDNLNNIDEKIDNADLEKTKESGELTDEIGSISLEKKPQTVLQSNKDSGTEVKHDNLSKIQNEVNLENKTSSDLEKNKDNLVEKSETKVDIVRVDESGIAVIAGTAEPSTTIEAKIGNQTVGTTEVNKDGGFFISGEISSSTEPQELKVITKADEVVKQDEEDTIIDNRDWVYETKSFVILPGLINEKNSQNVQNEKLDDIIIVEVKKQDLVIKEETKNITVEKLTLDRIKYSENGTAILFGRARKEMNVLVYLDNNFQTKTTPGLDGGWTVDLGIVEPGIYKLRIDETTNNGDVIFRIETPFKQEAKDLLDKMFTKAITVQPGNSLWRIARRIYGRGIMYLDIYKKNDHLIKDPNLIYPGQVFSLLD